MRGLAHTLTAQVAPGARFVQESRHRARIDSHIDTHNQQNQPAEGARGSSCEDSLTKWPVKQPREGVFLEGRPSCEDSLTQRSAGQPREEESAVPEVIV